MAPRASTSNLQLKSISQSRDGQDQQFIHFKATMRLPMAPVWASNKTGGGGLEGVKEVLSGWILRYLPPLRAVLLTFDPDSPTFPYSSATYSSSVSPFERLISSHPGDFMKSPEPEEAEEVDEEGQPIVQLKALPLIQGSGFALANVEWEGLAWRPSVGQKIVGSTTLSTPSHISLLLHNLFNASIPSSHIPDIYHFDPEFEVPEAIRSRQNFSFPSSAMDGGFEAPKTDDPVEGGEANKETEGVERENGEEEVVVDEEDGEAQMRLAESVVDEEEEKYKERGWWRNKVTNEPLGGANGRIEFTIVGLTITNSMITVTGSLLPNPFDVPAPSKRSVSVVQSSKKRRQQDDSDSSDSEDDSDDDDAEVITAPPRIKSRGSDGEDDEDVIVVKKKDKGGKKERKNRTAKSEKKSAEKKAKGKKPKTQ